MMKHRNLLRIAPICIFSLFLTRTGQSIDSRELETTFTESKDEQWIRLPIAVRPIEKIKVRDFKGATTDSYVNHPTSNRILRVRGGRSNELFFGPWRFQVDASKTLRNGQIDLSVRVSHVDHSAPESYLDLGQQNLRGKIFLDDNMYRFVSDARTRFQSPSSPIMAEVEWGAIDEAQLRNFRAAENAAETSIRATSAH